MPQTNHQRAAFFLIIGLGAIAIALVLNLISLFFLEKPETYLRYNDVRGMAVVHQGIPYTLNFEQQNEVVEILNRSIPVDSNYLTNTNTQPEFEKIVIYRFHKPDLELKSIAYVDGNYLFSAPEWQKTGYLREVTKGKLKALLSQTYDK